MGLRAAVSLVGSIRSTGSWVVGGTILFVSILFASVSTDAIGELRRERDGRGALELSPVERAEMTRLYASGRHSARLIMITAPGRVSHVARRLIQLAAEVWMIEADLDFLRASVPIAKVTEVMAWPDVTGAQVEIDGGLWGSGITDDGGPTVGTWPAVGVPPSAYTPRDNPYTSESTTESLQFKADHPTYDGRGTVIGGVEPINPRTPSLASALSLDGARVSKISDYIMLPPAQVSVEAVPERDQSAEWGWQETMEVHPGADGTVAFAGTRYSVPAEFAGDELRMTLYRLRATGVEPRIVVLWAVRAGRLWICLGDEVEFQEAIALTLPSGALHRAAVAQFGQDEFRTMRAAVDEDHRLIGLDFSLADHGTMCASVAAGHSFLNSRAEGVAPGAQWLPVDQLNVANSENIARPRSVLEAWLLLFRDARVDLVSNSTALRNGRTGLVDDRLVEWQLFQRLQARYPKAFITSVGNAGPHAKIGDGVGSSDSVITVGAYTSTEAWLANFGVTPLNVHTPAPYSAFGPSYDGGLKPDVLGLTGTLCSMDAAPGRATSYYGDVAGYGVSGGTSAAAPNVAGHVALLISAAKQAGIPRDSRRIKMALVSTAMFLHGVEARVQGHGLIQVAKAWQALERLREYALSTFVTQAPVRTTYSAQLATPNIGRGLYERSGWVPGQSGVREITITRTTGPAGAIEYGLRWKGDTAAFGSDRATIVLPLGQPVTLRVKVSLAESRAYSAIVDLVDPAVDLVVHSVMCTVIAAEPLTSVNGYTASINGVAPRPGNAFVFVDVPTGTTALRVQLTQHGGDRVNWKAEMPDGRVPRVGLPVDYGERNAVLDWSVGPSARQEYDQTFVNPPPGVWQLWVTHDNGTNSKPGPVRSSRFTMRLTAIGVEPTMGASIMANAPTATVTFSNRLASLAFVRVAPLGLGGVREERIRLPTGFAPTLRNVDVAPGTSKIEINVVSDDRDRGNVSLILLRPAETSAGLARYMAYDIGAGARKHVELYNPAPGRYVVAMDRWGAVGEGGMDVRYSDIVYHPMYGRLLVDDQAMRLATDGQISRLVSWRVDAYPQSGRRLVGQVGLVGSSYVNMTSNWLKLSRAASAAGTEDSFPTPTVTTDLVPIATQTIILQPSHRLADSRLRAEGLAARPPAFVSRRSGPTEPER